MCGAEAEYFTENFVCRKSSLETIPQIDSEHTTEKFPQSAVSLSDEIPQLITGEQERLELFSQAGDFTRFVISDGASSSVKNYFKTEKKNKVLVLLVQLFL